MFELTSRLLLFISLSDSYNKKAFVIPKGSYFVFRQKG